VVASKYGMAGEGADPIRAGGSRKAMRICVEESLRRLGTDYLDILYLHCWDFTVAADELMLAFDDLVRQGKILHAALSNVPAWIAARCVTMAECRGWPRPVAVQVPYSLASRGVERELLPMARDLNLGVAAWGPLGQGVLTSAPERRSGTGEVLHGVATAYGVSMARAALAWLRQRPDMSIIPVVGAATADEIGDCIASCNLTLDGDHLAALDAASAIELDYPYGLLGEPIYRDLLTGFRPDLLPDSGSSRATA
jgi:Predicted oxidoreductases (related to aryl-alcohol dehydrogenases)